MQGFNGAPVPMMPAIIHQEEHVCYHTPPPPPPLVSHEHVPYPTPPPPPPFTVVNHEGRVYKELFIHLVMTRSLSSTAKTDFFEMDIVAS